jgi:hypothetical protein
LKKEKCVKQNIYQRIKILKVPATSRYIAIYNLKKYLFPHRLKRELEVALL